MITWIQLRVQKHMRVLFLALLVVLVFAFVLTIGNQNFFGSHGDREFKTKDFYGYNLASDGTKNYLEQCAQISAILSQELMDKPNHLFPIDRYAKERAAGLALAKMLGIAAPSEEQLKDYLRAKPVFQDKDGKFSAMQYKTVMDALASRQGIAESGVLGILSEDYRIAKVRELLGGAGFITPDMLAIQRQSLQTQWTFMVASIAESSYNPEINPTDEQLQAFYKANQARFEIPEMIQLEQVRFPTVAYAAQVGQPTDDEINTFFNRNKAHYASGKTGDDGKPVEAVLDGVTKLKVVQDINDMKAAKMAADQANEYTLALWREELTNDSPRIDEIAKKMGGIVSKVAPFAKGNPPRNADADSDQMNSLWTLATSERYFSDVIQARSASSVFIFKGTIAARMPSFEEAKTEVADAYKSDMREKLFAQHGADLQKALDAAVKSGKSFNDEATAMGLSVVQHVNVKLEDADKSLVALGGPMDVAGHMKVGEVSPMQITDDGGFFVFLKDRQAPALDSVKGSSEELEQVRETVAASDGWEVLGALCEKRLSELEAAEKKPVE